LKLYYRKFGDGPVTLIVPLDYFLHDHFRQFANVATVVTYDLRNRGRSHRSKDESTWTIQQDARDLEAVRRELKIEKFVPIGFSYLGVVVAMYTLDHPDRVSRLVQIDPAPFRKFPDQPPLKEDYGIPAETEKRLNDLRAAGAYEKSPREFCTAIWDFYRYMFVGNPAHAERFDLSFCELENEWPVNFNPHVEHVMKSFANVDLTAEKLHGVKVPVLTIHGTKDRAAPYAGAVEWVKAFADARLVTVEGVAHAAWLDDPVTVFASIRHFLRGEWPLAATSPPR
jgi:pimeloyl-ACP methyl ester carboxylesterase